MSNRFKIMKKILWVVFAFISVFVIFYIYRSITQAHFNWEDAMFLGDAVKVWTEGNLKHVFTPWMKNYVRYFRQPLFVIFYKLYGYDATPYFTFVLFLRLTNVFLIYLLARKLTNSILISSFASIFYGIYQVNYQAMFWISSGTKEEPMVTFFLLCLLSFTKYLNSGKHLYLFLSSFSFFVCFHCEFKALMVPLVLLSYEFVFYMNKKKFFKFGWILKYLPFLLLEVYFFRFVYNGSAGLFTGIKDKFFLKVYPGSLPYYFVNINTLLRWRLATRNWGFNPNNTDEAFVLPLGLIILGLYIVYLLYWLFKKQSNNLKATLFLFAGVFFSYLPVALMVASGYGWLSVINVQWRYFALPSSVACILTASFVFWSVEEILRRLNSFMAKIKKSDQELLFVGKYPIVQIILCLMIFYNHYSMVKQLVDEYVLTSSWPKKIFADLKKAYPVFEKETVLAIEGVEDDSTPNYFHNRYLFENVFALYANPNNPNYLEEQKKLPFEPNEGPHRRLPRVLYYTNLKDVINGNHQFMYQPGYNISWAPPNINFLLPTFDREFLGAIYGFYDPQKFVVIKFLSGKQNEYGTYIDLTDIRRVQIQKFVDYYCFRDGKRNCNKPLPKFSNDKLVREIYNEFSLKGKEVFDYLLSLPPGILPNIYTLFQKNT